MLRRAHVIFESYEIGGVTEDEAFLSADRIEDLVLELVVSGILDRKLQKFHQYIITNKITHR